MNYELFVNLFFDGKKFFEFAGRRGTVLGIAVVVTESPQARGRVMHSVAGLTKEDTATLMQNRTRGEDL